MEFVGFDFSKLKGRIVEVYGYGGNKLYAEALGIEPETLSRKLNNKAEFSMREIKNSITILHLEHENLHDYFFKLNSSV